MTRRRIRAWWRAPCCSASRGAAARPRRARISLILAPSNLGLAPAENGRAARHLAGAPGADGGGPARCARRIRGRAARAARYEFDAQPAPGSATGKPIRAFSLELADAGAGRPGRRAIPRRRRRRLQRPARLPLRRYGWPAAAGSCTSTGTATSAPGESYDAPQTSRRRRRHGPCARERARGDAPHATGPTSARRSSQDADIVQIGERGAGRAVRSSSTMATSLHRDHPAHGAERARRGHRCGGSPRRRATRARGLETGLAPRRSRRARSERHARRRFAGQPRIRLRAARAALRCSARPAVSPAPTSDLRPERDPGHAHAARLVRCIAEGIRRDEAQLAVASSLLDCCSFLGVADGEGRRTVPAARRDDRRPFGVDDFDFLMGEWRVRHRI